MPRPIDLPAPWSDLAAHYGGVSALAARLGINRSTYARWAKSEILPCKAHEEALLDLFEACHLPPPTFRGPTPHALPAAPSV